MGFIALNRENDRRPVVIPCKTGRHNADDPLMPPLPCRGYRYGFVKKRIGFHLTFRFGENLLFFCLPPLIERFQHVGKLVCVHNIGGVQEFQCGNCVSEPAGCVDARRQFECNIRRADRGIDMCHFNQCTNPRTQLFAERLHAVFDKNPVFPEQRNDIRNGAESDKIQHILHFRGITAEIIVTPVFHERMRQFESHPYPGKLMHVSQFLMDFRVDDCQRGRRFFAGFMVIGDNNINPLGRRIRNSRTTVDSAVDRNQNLAWGRSRLQCFGKRFRRKTVAVIESVRKKRADDSPVLFQYP